MTTPQPASASNAPAAPSTVGPAAGRGALAVLALVGGISWALVATGDPSPGLPLQPLTSLVAQPTSAAPARDVMAARPARNPDVYPCSACHEPGQNDLTPRPMTIAHVGLVLRHGPGPGWCFDCHAREERDELTLVDGRRVPIDDAMPLCGQCHGPQLRDWKHGAHGGATGFWAKGAGDRVRRACVTCHDPHAPAFKRLESVFAPRDARGASHE